MSYNALVLDIYNLFCLRMLRLIFSLTLTNILICSLFACNMQYNSIQIIINIWHHSVWYRHTALLLLGGLTGGFFRE